MLDRELVYNKLTDLSSYYQKIKNIAKDDTTIIIKDDLKLHSIERLFQNI